MKRHVSMNVLRVGTLALAAVIAACSGASNSPAPSAQSMLPTTVSHASGTTCAYTSDEHFNSKIDIPAGSWLLFTSVFRVPPGQAGLLRFQVSHSYITFTAGSQSYTIQAPGARISLHDGTVKSAVHLNWAKGGQSKHGIWWLMAPYQTMNKDYGDFMDQVAWQVPAPGLSGSDFKGSNSVTWHATFTSGKYAGTDIQWQWGAAVYTQLDNFADYNSLGAKPVDDPAYGPYFNGDPAGTPETGINKSYLVDGATNQGGQLDFIGGAEKNHVEHAYPCKK